MGTIGKRRGALNGGIPETVTAIDQLRRVLLDFETALTECEKNGLGQHPLRMEAPRSYAQRLHVDVDDVRAWVEAGMPHVKVGKKLRIMTFEADEWLRARKGQQLRA